MAKRNNNDLKIIKRSVSGVLQTDRAIKLVRELSNQADLHRGNNILMDLRGTMIGLEMIDLMAITSSFSKQLSNFDCKIALLITNTKGRVQFAELFKSCMEVQGFKFNQFFDYSTAVEWLSK